MANAMSCWTYPPSEAYSEVSFHGTSTDKAKVIEFDKEEQALIKKHCLQCSIKNRNKAEVVQCKEIFKAEQTGWVHPDSESSLALRNVFPLTRSNVKFKLPPKRITKKVPSSMWIRRRCTRMTGSLGLYTTD